MPREIFFEWEGAEYAFEEKGSDWYWAVGIITAALVVACILFSNIILALVVVAAAGALALQAAKHPRVHHFRVTERGLMVDDALYTFDDMISFSVLEYLDPALPTALSIKTRHLLAPHLLIPIREHDPLVIYDFFEEHVEEGRHDESIIDRLVELIRP